MATDGKVLRGSYAALSDDPTVTSQPAIMLVTAYIVERGLSLDSYEVESQTNEMRALPSFIKQMAWQGVVFAFDAYAVGGAKLYSTQKNSSDHLHLASVPNAELKAQELRLHSPNAFDHLVLRLNTVVYSQKECISVQEINRLLALR